MNTITPTVLYNLSPAQLKVVSILKADPNAYIVKTRLWDFQHIILCSGKQKYFKKRTLEVLERKGVIVEFEPNKFRLAYYNQTTKP